MMTVDLDSPVGQWVAEQPGLARVFGKLGIDYCCQGSVPFRKVFADLGLDGATAAQILKASEYGKSVDDHGNWQLASTSQLIEHIVAEHHGFLRAELPRLGHLLEMSKNNNQLNIPQLEAVEGVYKNFQKLVMTTVEQEEKELFFVLRQRDTLTSGEVGTIEPVVTRLKANHIGVGEQMHKLANLTEQFRVGENMPECYRAFLEGLKELIEDIHVHLHEEDYILFEKTERMIQNAR